MDYSDVAKICPVEESTGGRGGSPGLVKVVSHLSDTDRCET